MSFSNKAYYEEDLSIYYHDEMDILKRVHSIPMQGKTTYLQQQLRRMRLRGLRRWPHKRRRLGCIASSRWGRVFAVTILKLDWWQWPNLLHFYWTGFQQHSSNEKGSLPGGGGVWVRCCSSFSLAQSVLCTEDETITTQTTKEAFSANNNLYPMGRRWKRNYNLGTVPYMRKFGLFICIASGGYRNLSGDSDVL